MPRASLPKLTEKEFQSQVVKLAKLCGWKVYHTWMSLRSDPGFPDLMLIRGTRMVVAELKVGTKVTPAQQGWLDAFAKAGVWAYLWRPSDWEEIQRILTRPEPTP